MEPGAIPNEDRLVVLAFAAVIAIPLPSGCVFQPLKAQPVLVKPFELKLVVEFISTLV